MVTNSGLSLQKFLTQDNHDEVSNAVQKVTMVLSLYKDWFLNPDKTVTDNH